VPGGTQLDSGMLYVLESVVKQLRVEKEQDRIVMCDKTNDTAMRTVILKLGGYRFFFFAIMS
jgi:hypothetical protein